MAVRPQLQALLDDALELRTKSAPALKKLKPNQLTWSPGRDRWTIAQILDHVAKSTDLTLTRFEEALRGADPAAEERDQTIKYRFGERVFLKMVGPNAPVKLPVPPMFEPEASPNAAKVVKRFFEVHDSVVKLIERADGFRLRGLRVVSPVTARVRPGFIAYLDVLIAHEAYHLRQIEELIADPDFPK